MDLSLSSPSSRQGRDELLLYGSVHFGKTLLWVGEDALALYLMVRLLAVPPALAGGLFLASAMLNAACDGLFGSALARSSAMSRHLPGLLWWAVPISGISFAALPFLPVGSTGAVILLLLLFRLTFSLADVPHNALTQALTRRHGHLGIARIRAWLGGGASLVIAVVAFMVLGAGDDDRLTTMSLIGAVGLLAVLLMAPLPMLVRRYWGAQPYPVGGSAIHVPAGVIVFCLASAFGLSGLAALGKAILHIDFAVPTIGAAALILITAGRLGSIWIWSPLARRLGNRQALALGYAASGIAAFLVPWLASSAFGLGTVLLLLAAGLTGGGIALLSWACLSETITNGKRPAEGDGAAALAFACYTMSTKVALGLSGVLVGAWLSAGEDPLHRDPFSFWTLAGVVFAMSVLTAGVISRKDFRS